MNIANLTYTGHDKHVISKYVVGALKRYVHSNSNIYNEILAAQVFGNASKVLQIFTGSWQITIVMFYVGESSRIPSGAHPGFGGGTWLQNGSEWGQVYTFLMPKDVLGVVLHGNLHAVIFHFMLHLIKSI